MILTPRRRAILKAIRAKARPSWRELQVATKTPTMATIYNNLRALQRHGYVNYEPGYARTLRLTSKGILASQGYKLLWTADKDGVHKEA